MKNKTKVFQPIDEAIFKVMDGLRANARYQQLMNSLENLPDSQLKIINQTASYLLISMPLVILLILFLVRTSAVSNYELNKDILNEVQAMKSNHDLAQNLGSTLVSNYSLTTKDDFDKRIGVSVSSNGINPTNVRVASFESEETGSMVKSTAVLTFNSFSSKNLTDLLKTLMQTQKMKIEEIETLLNERESTLSGSLNVIHFGKK